jgi:hypothetical protein
MRQRNSLSRILALLFFLVVADATAQASQQEAPLFVAVHLPYGISVEIPRVWRMIVGDTKEIQEMGVSEDINVSDMPLPDNKVLFRAVATPADQPASMSVAFLPKALLTLPQAVDLSPGDLADYDRELRRQVESPFRNQGRELLEWGGTRKEHLNGRVTLVSEYRGRSPGNPAVWKQINMIPLNEGMVVLTVTHNEQAGLLWRSVVMRIRSSCRINSGH